MGSTAPFIGLFGTVIGIYRALDARSVPLAGRRSTPVAGPVGEALIMTAVGLAVAVPARARLQLAAGPQQEDLTESLERFLERSCSAISLPDGRVRPGRRQGCSRQGRSGRDDRHRAAR